MAPIKRRREVVDLTGDDEPGSKFARQASPGPSSSRSTAPRSSQPSNGHHFTPPSSVRSLSGFPASSQVIDGDDDGTLDLTQDDDGVPLELYGTLDNKIVGVRYYNGIATPHELVAIRREPNNQYDRNAIRIDNVIGQQIGHLPRKFVEKLAPYIDEDEIVLEGVLDGEKGQWDCPIKLYIYGPSNPTLRSRLEEKLKSDKLLKAMQLKTTRKEAEARRRQLGANERDEDSQNKATGLKSGTTSAGMATAEREEQEASLQDLFAASEAMDSRRTDELTDTLAIGEDALSKMPMAEQPIALKSRLLPYQLQVRRLPTNLRMRKLTEDRGWPG